MKNFSHDVNFCTGALRIRTASRFSNSRFKDPSSRNDPTLVSVYASAKSAFGLW